MMRRRKRSRRCTFCAASRSSLSGTIPERAKRSRARSISTRALGAARFNLGRLRLGQKRYPEAAEEFRKLTELAPKDASAQHLLGVACHESGNLGEARVALQKALELHPGNVQSSLRLAAVLFDLGLYEESIAAFEKAIAGGADGIPVRKALARARLKRGDFKEAARGPAEDRGRR